MADRGLTAGETALARAAHGDRIAYQSVRIVDGPGTSFAAHIAFMRGNPAITLSRTIYFKTPWHDDFTAAGEKARSDLLHELTHVVQYQRLGLIRFGLRYARELAACGFNASRMYHYEKAGRKFPKATLEGQAQMVGDYILALLRGDARRAAEVAPWLEGSGFFEF